MIDGMGVLWYAMSTWQGRAEFVLYSTDYGVTQSNSLWAREPVSCQLRYLAREQ